MKVVEIFRENFGECFKVKHMNEEIIAFSNGLTITFFHEQDCCESVYCDFEQVESLFKKQIYTELIIEMVENCGIRVNGFFIPCYDVSNGYYSSDLELIIQYKSKIWSLDIEAASEHIYN